MATVFKRGNVWRAMVSTRGGRVTKTLDTEAEARAWVATETARSIAGALPTPAAQPIEGITGAALFARYAREISPEKRGGRWEVIRLAKLAPDFPMPAASIDGATMAAWRDARLRAVSKASVRRELNLISAVFTKAIKEWRLPMAASPVRQIEWPKPPRARRRRVSDQERASIIAALGWDGSSKPATRRQWVAFGFCLALETMMRLGEILALTWGHVHTYRKFCHLPHTKNGHDRNVPLSTRAVALFGLLAPGLGGQRVIPVNAGTFGLYFRAAVKGAGIEDLHFHDTRREALTRMSRRLTNVAELARASGHRELRSLMIYYEPDIEEIADKLD